MAKAEVGKAPVAPRPLPTSNTVKGPADGEASAASRPLSASNTVKGPADGEASAASRPLPASNTVKGSAAGEAKVGGVKRVESVAANAEKEKATMMVPKPSGDKSGETNRPSGTAASGSSAPAPRNDKPASANKGFGSPGRFRTPTAKTPSRKVDPYARDSISTPGPSGLKVAAHKALNRVNVKPSTPAPAASGGNETHTPSSGNTTQDAFAKFRAMYSNSKKGGPSFKLRSTPLSKTVSPAKHGNSHLVPPPSHKADVDSIFSGSRAPPSTTSKREAQEVQAAAALSKATQLAQVEAAAPASRTRAALAAEKKRERARAKALAEKAAADEARREAKVETRARQAAFKAAAERTAKEKAAREAVMRKRKEEDRKREADKREQEKHAHAIAAEALRQAELKRKEEEVKAAAAAAEAAEATAAAAVAAAVAEAAVRREAESAAAALKRPQQQKVTSAAEPPTPPRPSGKVLPTPPRPAPQPGAPPTPPRPLSMQPGRRAQAQAQAQAQTHVQMPNHAHVKTQTHVQMQALVQQPPHASPWTPLKIGASSAAGDKQEHEVELAKKKREIVKRMEEMRKVQASSKPPHVAKPATMVMTTPAPVPSPVKSVHKEDKESYDGHELEDKSVAKSVEDGEKAAQEIAEPQEPNDNGN